jgi:DNA transposition AAA+ family ATPase
MTATELKNHPVVRRLTSIQEALGLKNIPFADILRLGIHGANWGKILAGNYTGSFSNALTKLEVALDAYEHPGTGDVEEGVVLLSHVREALDAFEIASKADDEHQLVILAGQRGAGKTKTISLVHHRYGGSSLEALPSWAGSYYDFLKQFADGLGVTATGCHSKGAFEMAILSDLAASPRPIFTDEFNYFSPAGINFVKAILNRTRCPVMLASVPHFLSRMAADTRTAQESSQLIRRAVAVIHIPAVTEREVVQLQTTLFPNLELSADAARAIATSANRLGRLDSVYAILEDAESPADIQKAIGRHQRSKKTTLLPKEE